MQFLHKKQTESQIFIDKKRLSAKIFFSDTTKNLKREILTKNLVTFKRWDEIKDEKFILWGFTEKSEGGSRKNNILGELPEKKKGGGRGQFADLGGGGGILAKKRGVVFLMGKLIP